MRLAGGTLDRLPEGVSRFSYDRAAQKVGIVHFGIGAFHRAHQAWYTDAAMNAGGRDWMIAGVSLRSPDVAAQLNPQDGLYSLTERSAAGNAVRVVGSVKQVLVATTAADAAIAALAAPSVHIASLTVTEKGYCRAADGSLDAALAGPGSIYGFLAAGLRQRRDVGLGGLTLLSCDNLPDNGRLLQQLLVQHCEEHDPALAQWVARECAFPSSMVDRIVPATTEQDRDAVDAALGFRDEAAVVTEPFSQWVIEDRFAGVRPRWEQVGAELVTNVAPYEAAKLRMLNGAHSALAYLGLARGHAFVHRAVADPEIRGLVERLMRDEALPSIDAAPSQDLHAYSSTLLARFANPALNHRLSQIAMDGSQKIPQRWLATLADRQRHGLPCHAILTALAAWLRHARGDNGAVDDPMASGLRDAWLQAGEAGVVDAILGPDGLLASAWTPAASDREWIMRGLTGGPAI